MGLSIQPVVPQQPKMPEKPIKPEVKPATKTPIKAEELAKILGLEIRSPKNLKTIAAQLVYDTKTGQPKAIWFSPKASEIEKLHEIGHAIDFKNKLTQKFIENREVIPQKEFKDIIELFIERSPNRIKYAFDTKEHMAQIIGSFLENPKDFVSKRPELTKFL